MKKWSAAYFTASLAIVLITCSKADATPEQEIINENLNANGKVQISAKEMEHELLELINTHRASIGTNVLLPSSETYPFAEDHNTYMIAQNKLSHDHFDSRAAAIVARTDASKIGENIGMHYSSAQQAEDGWMQRESHISTLEENYTHSALSVVLDKEGRPYFTQIFLLVE